MLYNLLLDRMICERCWKETKDAPRKKYCYNCRKEVDAELKQKYIDKHRVPDSERKIKRKRESD